MGFSTTRRLAARDQRAREETCMNRNCRRNSGAATKRRQHGTSLSAEKAGADTDGMTGTTPLLRFADKKVSEPQQLGASRQRHRHIYIYAYMSPHWWRTSGGDIHASAVPPPAVVLRTAGGAKDDPSRGGGRSEVEDLTYTNTYIHTYVYI